MDVCYALRDYRLSQSAKLVYGVLAALSAVSERRGKPYTYISRKAIGERIGRSERTAQRAVNELQRAGLISVKRMGRTLNDHIFVFPPRTPQDVKETTVAGVDHSIYSSGGTGTRSTAAAPAAAGGSPRPGADAGAHSAAVAAPCAGASVSGQECAFLSCHIPNVSKTNIKSEIDISIYPENGEKGRTKPKGKPTPKRPRVSPDERQRIRKKYRDYLREHLQYETVRRDWIVPYQDADALAKIIDLMANAMASKSAISVNGALLTPSQWWYVVKNISQESVFSVIYREPHFKNVKKPNAYILATLYNEAMRDVLERPFYESSAPVPAWAWA